VPPENPPTEECVPPGSGGYTASDLLPELARAHAEQRAPEADDVEDLVVSLPLPDLGQADAYPRWHSSYPQESIARALLLKHVYGLSSDAALRRRLRGDPFLLGKLGFDRVPNQSTVWRARERRFADDLLAALREAARELAEVARDHGLDAPGPVEQADDPDDGDADHRDGRLGKPSPVVGEADRVAEATRREVFPALELDRAVNATIPESAFWSLQTYLGLREDLHANAGAELFAREASDVTPLGHNHRDQLREQSIDDYRAMLSEAVANVVTEAKREGVLDRKVTVAIDITTSTPFYGDRDGRENVVLGTKEQNDDYAYHWATIQVVDSECPIVLDARPVERGDSRAEIVADLLDSALQHVAIDLVLADREFDGDEVKSACEVRNLRYLTPKRKHSSERATEKRLSRADREVHVELQQTVQGPDRKTIYLRRGTEDTGNAGVEVTEYQREYRQTLWSELEDEVGLDLGTDEKEEAALHHLGTDLLGDEGTEEGDDVDRYIVFETNTDLPNDSDEDELRRAVRRLTRRYRERWTIENGYKSLKSFIVPTTSKSHALRYFNFVFACLLFNVWKLVDLLLRQLFGVEDGPILPASQVLAAVRRATGIG